MSEQLWSKDEKRKMGDTGIPAVTFFGSMAVGLVMWFIIIRTLIAIGFS